MVRWCSGGVCGLTRARQTGLHQDLHHMVQLTQDPLAAGARGRVPAEAKVSTCLQGLTCCPPCLSAWSPSCGRDCQCLQITLPLSWGLYSLVFQIFDQQLLKASPISLRAVHFPNTALHAPQSLHTWGNGQCGDQVWFRATG